MRVGIKGHLSNIVKIFKKQLFIHPCLPPLPPPLFKDVWGRGWWENHDGGERDAREKSEKELENDVIHTLASLPKRS